MLGSKIVVAVSLVLLTIATIGIVSTGPGYTLFGLLQLPGADSGGLFGTPAEKAYIGFGLLIGMAESFVAGYISSTFQNIIVFAILNTFMLVRPTGLLGKVDIRKV